MSRAYTDAESTAQVNVRARVYEELKAQGISSGMADRFSNDHDSPVQVYIFPQDDGSYQFRISYWRGVTGNETKNKDHGLIIDLVIKLGLQPDHENNSPCGHQYFTRNFRSLSELEQLVAENTRPQSPTSQKSADGRVANPANMFRG